MFIQGELCEEKMDWLKSCIGTVLNLFELETIASMLAFLGLRISRIRDIGKFMFLVTFAAKEDMNESLKEASDLFFTVLILLGLGQRRM